MKTLLIVASIALLDLGFEDPSVEKLIIVDGAKKFNSDGTVTAETQALASRVLSTQAVANGATRINLSDCVDASTGNGESKDDHMRYYKLGETFELVDTAALITIIQNSTDAYYEIDGHRERAIAYVEHIEARQNFLIAQSVLVEPTEVPIHIVAPSVAMSMPTMDMDVDIKHKALFDQAITVIGYLKMLPFASPYIDTIDGIKEILLFVEKKLVDFGVLNYIGEHDYEALAMDIQESTRG